MHALAQKNVLVGSIFTAVGLIGVIAASKLNIGTVTNLGPGGFPVILGAILVVLGAANIIKGIAVSGEAITLRNVTWRVALIPLAVLIFSLTIDRFGLLPSVFVAALVGGFANPRFKYWEILVISVVLAAACVGLFIYLLGLPFYVIGTF